MKTSCGRKGVDDRQCVPAARVREAASCVDPILTSIAFYMELLVDDFLPRKQHSIHGLALAKKLERQASEQMIKD